MLGLKVMMVTAAANLSVNLALLIMMCQTQGHNTRYRSPVEELFDIDQ
jgi:hypothetical protein